MENFADMTREKNVFSSKSIPTFLYQNNCNFTWEKFFLKVKDDLCQTVEENIHYPKSALIISVILVTN